MKRLIHTIFAAILAWFQSHACPYAAPRCTWRSRCDACLQDDAW